MLVEVVGLDGGFLDGAVGGDEGGSCLPADFVGWVVGMTCELCCY